MAGRQGAILRIRTGTAAATERLGRRLGKLLQPGAVLALEGELGSGKTVFVRGLARGLKVERPDEVASPTFALIQEHSGPKPLCHADLYRLAADEAGRLGLEEYWTAPDWVVAVEWADKASALLPPGLLRVRLRALSETARELEFSGALSWKSILRRLRSAS